MDSTIAFKGKDFIIMAADTINTYSIMKMKAHDDKIWHLGNNMLLSIGGEHSDILTFGDYIQKNLKFMQFKNGVKLSTEKTANFIRSELAEALRKGPYQVNTILGGFDGDVPKLYWIDYLGTLVETDKAAHGYAEYFVYSTMDTLNKKDMSVDDGIALINYCIKEIQTRFMASQPTFVVKLITKDGIRIITPIEKPIPVQCG